MIDEVLARPFDVLSISVKNLSRIRDNRILVFEIVCLFFFALDNKYLYSIEYTYVDMEVDENGLWAIYGGDQRENDLMVAKLNAESLQVREN